MIWKEGAIGVDLPASLLPATFYTVRLHFCLRGGQEHRDLIRSQFTRVPADGYNGLTYYQYVENGSKNYQGRFNEETGQPNRLDVHTHNLTRVVGVPCEFFLSIPGEIVPWVYSVLHASFTEASYWALPTMI